MTILRLCLRLSAIIAQKDALAKSRNESIHAHVSGIREKLFFIRGVFLIPSTCEAVDKHKNRFALILHLGNPRSG
jgi:hypothetical protein